MKKLILSFALSFGFIFSAFAQEYKFLNVEIRKDGELVSAYKSLFTGLPEQVKRISFVSYVKEIKAVPANSTTGLHEIVMGEIETGTILNYNKNSIQAVIYDDLQFDVTAFDSGNIQKPHYNTYSVEFPAKTTIGMVQIAEINNIKISYSLE